MKCFEEADNVAPSSGHLEDILADMERKIIIEELKRWRGNRARAARALGITERIMGLRITKYKIDPAELKESHRSHKQME